jgi:hypothetical protein
MEAATHKPTSNSLQHDELTDVYVDIRERWQVDPELPVDTRGPEYLWRHIESPGNDLTVEARPPEKVHGS